MDSEPSGPDDLDVELQWPENQDVERESLGPRGRARKRAHDRDEAPGELVAGANDWPGSEPTVAALAIRLEALAGATTMMKIAISDRLTDLSDQVTRASQAESRNLDDYRLSHDRVVADLRERMAQLEAEFTRTNLERARAQQELDERLKLLGELLEDLVAPAVEVLLQQSQESRADRAALQKAMSGMAAQQAERLDAIRQRVEAVEMAAPGGAWQQEIKDSVDRMSQQLLLLRRRIALRARPEPAPEKPPVPRRRSGS